MPTYRMYWVYTPTFLHHLLRAILFTIVNLIETEPLQNRYMVFGFFIFCLHLGLLKCERMYTYVFVYVCVFSSQQREI